jgi:hypothetical protein
MAIISITVLESSEQVAAGIPCSVTISTNISATVFYTLDGTDPTLLSEMYISPIVLPTDLLKIELRILATNGILFSPIITEVYQTDILVDIRLPHSATDAQAENNIPGLYPFGTNPIQPNAQFLSPAEASITVDNPAKTQIPSGYDGSGNEVGFTNEPYNLENYSIVYATRNSQGQPSVGNLPANVKIEIPAAPPEETQQFSNLFDPRALVIFQDFSKEDPNDPPQINREFFSLEDNEKVRDGNNYYNSGLDAPPVMGSFLRSHYNPRDNTITYYYLDTHTNKWIISKTPYKPTGTFTGNLSGMALSKNKGAGVVFEWLPFTRRVLF